MGSVLTTLTVPSTVGGVSAGVNASGLLGANRTINFAGLVAGDTLVLQAANQDTSAKYANVLQVSYNGSAAQQVTLTAEDSQFYRVKRLQLAVGNPGTGRTVVVAGDPTSDNTNTLLWTDEWIAPPAPATAGLHAALGTTVAIQTVTAAMMIAAGLTVVFNSPRNITFTTADNGGTVANAPHDAVITGTDINGLPITETVIGLHTGGPSTHQGTFPFKTIVDVTYTAATLADGNTIAIGHGQKLAMTRTITTFAGAPNVLQEIYAGAPHGPGVGGGKQTGTVVVPGGGTGGSYSPAATPNGVLSFALTYEVIT